MIALKTLLDNAENGETEIVLHYHDKKIPFAKKIAKTAELEKKIEELAG